MGASPDRSRYSNIASLMLQDYGHDVVCHGKRKGECAGITIQNEFPVNEKFDTITLYLNPSHQESFRDLIVQSAPKRVIFNPGTENPEFEAELEQHGIQAVEACTLVMLRTGQW